MTPNAAMETTPPKAPHPFYAHGRWYGHDNKYANRPTSLMVHIEGHGPRRIYRSDYTSRYYYILKRRKIVIDVQAILRLLN